jgi:aerobic carbon-monoxide dehydrogenase small subunit
MSRKHHVAITVNGDEYEYLCEPQQTLLDALRDELMLTGTKEGCATGDCGACTVMVDGTMICACLMLAVEADGKSVETIEGIAKGEELHPLQRIFLELNGLQCGICTPGILIAAKALLAIPIRPRPRCATGSPAICAAAPATTRSSARCWRPPRK